MKYIGAGAVPTVVSAVEFRRAVPSTEICPDDDMLLEIYLSAAQEVVAYAAGRPLAVGEYEFTVRGCWRRWWFPCAPVNEITGLAVMESDGIWETQALGEVRLVDGYTEPQIALPEGWGGFQEGVHDFPFHTRVRATVGHDVPPLALRQAVILLAKEWLEAGLSVDEVDRPRMSFGVTALIRQRRYMRPKVVA